MASYIPAEVSELVYPSGYSSSFREKPRKTGTRKIDLPRVAFLTPHSVLMQLTVSPTFAPKKWVLSDADAVSYHLLLQHADTIGSMVRNLAVQQQNRKDEGMDV
ncbi:hypothetical protein CONPUDRAFT_140521 [Coniophora puteana RWD-64-598 SS2]|uniref:Uncharacterized protein n=1 Tax=Coniophora puteana (strain RWD-64-598) TaxID=741705 RepID=R7SE06_CONPW|nr:uncharacterized protein CONPUDRAFT_140521 [Coniophora puteana RWD-64-598 SS2]EIW74403.1 hypothetical protein CONPUDRAFT_140521 [Coniophora puteana RWD-64-598 SS2]